MSDRVTMSIAHGIADVQMSRPDKRNALDAAMFTALAEAGESLKSEPGVRVVVLSGQGPSFCAGLDFGSFRQMASGARDGSTRDHGDDNVGDREGETASTTDGDPSRLTPGAVTHLGQQIAWVWQELAVPVIAAVHGHAFGGGLQIALGADIRIVHPDAKMSVREVHWGLTPDMTATLLLSRLVRPDVAKELTFTARLVSGAEAAGLGLATRLSEQPYDDAMALAAEIAGRSPGAVKGAKALLNRIVNEGARDQFEAERNTIAGLIGSPNQVEAVTAEFEKRPPVFTDAG